MDEYGQLQRRLQIEQDCRTEAEKYACKVRLLISMSFLAISWSHSASERLYMLDNANRIVQYCVNIHSQIYGAGGPGPRPPTN